MENNISFFKLFRFFSKEQKGNWDLQFSVERKVNTQAGVNPICYE